MIKTKKRIVTITSVALCFLMVLSMVPISVQAAGTNLAGNPGAESYNGNGAVTVWGGYPLSNTTLSGSTVQKRSGSRSFCITQTTTSGGGEWYQGLTLSAGKTYEFSAWVYTNEVSSFSGSSDGAYISINNYANNTEIHSETIKRNTNGWYKLTATFSPTITRSYDIALAAYGTRGNVYFDDVSLIERASTPFTEAEIELLAKLVFWEINNGNSYAKELVAQVAVNRVNRSGFPDTLYGVITAPGQYSTKDLVIGNTWVSNSSYASTKDACFAAARNVAYGISVDEWGNSWPTNVLYHGTYSSSTSPAPNTWHYRTISGENFFCQS